MDYSKQMTTNYTFTIATINKPQAFQAYMQTNFAGLFLDFSYSNPNLSIDTTAPLTDDQLATLTTLVNNYVDPAVFLELVTTTSSPYVSLPTNSATPECVLTFIRIGSDPTTGTLNAFKTALSFGTTDVTQFATGDTSCTITFQIFNSTTNQQLTSNTIDISSTIQAWQTLAQNGGTGAQLAYQTFMVEGLRAFLMTTDSIWQFWIGVSNPNVTVVSNSLQSLYYNIM